MMNLPLNFSAPTGQVQNTYVQPTRTNPYLTSLQYSDMQQHTPSGYYYQGGKFYEPYTVGTKTISTPTPYSQFGGQFVSYGMPRYSTVPDIAEGSIQSGSQYFKPFTGNATGIINGDLSMAAMLGQRQQYQPQGIPNNLFNFLSTPSMQPTISQQSAGAGRFAGLLGSPITTNVQSK